MCAGCTVDVNCAQFFLMDLQTAGISLRDLVDFVVTDTYAKSRLLLQYYYYNKLQ